jgi:hypothetical protein
MDSSIHFKPKDSQNVNSAHKDEKQNYNPLNMQVEFGGDWNKDFDTDDNDSIISYETWNQQRKETKHSMRATPFQGNNSSYSMDIFSLADTTVNTFVQSTSHNSVQKGNLRGKYPPRTNKFPTGYLGQSSSRAKEALGLSDDLSLADTTVNTFAQSTSHNPDRTRFQDQPLSQESLRGEAALTQSEDAESEESDKKIV